MRLGEKWLVKLDLEGLLYSCHLQSSQSGFRRIKATDSEKHLILLLFLLLLYCFCFSFVVVFVVVYVCFCCCRCCCFGLLLFLLLILFKLTHQCLFMTGYMERGIQNPLSNVSLVNNKKILFLR